jgi:hypothetical protein
MNIAERLSEFRALLALVEQHPGLLLEHRVSASAPNAEDIALLRQICESLQLDPTRVEESALQESIAVLAQTERGHASVVALAATPVDRQRDTHLAVIAQYAKHRAASRAASAEAAAAAAAY